MTFSRLAELAVYLLAGLGLLALGLGGELSRAAQGVLWGGAALSLFIPRPWRAAPLYTRTWSVVIVGVFGIQVARAFFTESAWLGVGLELAGFLQVSRLFTRRFARDDRQIAVLALVHLVAATVLSSELSFGAIYVGFVVLTPWVLTLSMLRGQLETEKGRGEKLNMALASRTLIGPRFLLGTAALSVPVLSVTAVVFLLFPRVGMGLLSFERRTGHHTTGFSSNVELGQVGLIRDDPTVVLRVIPPGLPSDPPERAALRMRGTAFDHYDGRAWSRRQESARLTSSSFGHYQLRPRYGLEGTAPYQVILDAIDERVVFLPTGTVAVSIPPKVRGGRREEVELIWGIGDEYRYTDTTGAGLSYSAHVASESVPVPLSSRARLIYTEVPRGTAQIAALAAEVTQGVMAQEVSAGALAKAIEHHLRDSGRYRYTLDLPNVGARAPLDVFLFDARAGHCEYFSSAMVIMLRTLGVPSRVVTGFVGGRYNRFGGYYAIRQGDAHSWVEVFVENRGWLTFDPTPAARDSLGPTESAWSLAPLLDALRVRWNRWIVQYDLETQMQLGEKVRDWFRRASPRADEPTGVVTPPVARSGPLDLAAVALWGIPLAVIALGLVALWWQTQKRAGRARTGEAAVRLYQRLDRRLRRRGHPRPASRTPLEHLAVLEARTFGSAALVRIVTERYNAARYGEEPLTREDLTRLREAIARI